MTAERAPHPILPGRAYSSAVPSGDDIETRTQSRRPPAAVPAVGPSLVQRLAVALATAGGIGYAPIAPGTAGSAAAVALFLLVSRLSPPVYLLGVAAIAAVGVWAAAESERAFGRSDDGRIVIDEVAGQLLTFAPLVWTGGGNAPGLLVTGFVAFRCFDIWKPGPVRWAERGFSGGRFSGGLGVMADDLLAGLLAAGVVVLAGFAFGWGGAGAAG